jgi:hypothetical protein
MRKGRQYIGSSDGKIQAVLILDLRYPHPTQAWVSLLAANGPPDHLIQDHVLYFDDNLDQQPVGQVDLYFSDFVGFAGLPADYCRPTAAESDAGITRNPTVTLTYDRLRAIFRWARHAHDQAKFTIEVGDEPEDPLDKADRLAEIELERRVAEELERRVAEEVERRVAIRLSKEEEHFTEA